MIRQAACQSVIIYIFIKIPVTSFYTHSFNSRVFFRFNPKPEKKSIKESVFISSVAQQAVNIHLPLKCKNNSGWWWNKDIWIKLKTSTYASSQPDVHGSSRGGREQRGRDETAATRKGNPFCSWHTCQTFWRLWNGSRPRPDPSRNRAQVWPGRRPASGRWRKKKGFRIGSAFQIQTCSASSESEKSQVDRFSLLTLAFIFPLWKRPRLGDAIQNKHITQAKTTSGTTGGICSAGDTKASVSCSQVVIRLPVCSQIPSISNLHFET